jgi:hypothetical protein
MSSGNSGTDAVRDALLGHSDHRAVRNVFQAQNGGTEADLTDLVETMRVTDGTVALVAQDGAADIYARWTGNRFEHLTVWPPWTIANYDHKSRSDLEAYLDDKMNIRPTLYDSTPFASPATLSSLQHLLWP